MKFPHSMLLDFVRTSLTAEQLGDLLTMAGFELEGIEEVDGEAVLDIKVMSNRGDGLSVFGLAREVLAKDPTSEASDLYRAAAARFEGFSPGEQLILSSDAATIEAGDCNRFACRAFEGFLADSQSPTWMAERLAKAGMRPISLIVDLTNYVMLELGQPLHAFDRDVLAEGRIVVRHARPGEKITTLNGVEHELSGQMMICDSQKPVGVPGVMGGLEAEVTDATTRLLLESANFRNTTVRATRKQLGLSTEASYRFERSVDPDGVVAAIRRFSQLLLQSSPEVQWSNIVDHYPMPPEREEIAVRASRSSAMLGVEVSVEEAETHLSRLGMQVRRAAGDSLSVIPPSWRPDIVREIDLIEEIGRVHGYERIPERLPEGVTPLGGPQGFELWSDKLREAAVRAGFIQTVSHSLRDLHPLDEPQMERIGPRNPASPDMSFLRNSILPSLADAARRNGGKDLALFEIGRTFEARQTCYVEQSRIAFLESGEGFFELKGRLEAVLLAGGTTMRCAPSSQPDPRLHPTRQAALVTENGSIGLLGQIHPDIAMACELPDTTILAELWMTAAYDSRSDTLSLHPVSRFPAVRRDISIQIDKTKSFAQIEEAISDACGKELEKQWLFDVYEGKGIPSGSHSLAIALQLRKLDGTFTDEEANQVRDRALEALAALGATRR